MMEKSCKCDEGSRSSSTVSNSLQTPQMKAFLLEDHNLVPSLPDNPKSQTHSRVPECDGQPPVQVEPSPDNRMVTASTGIQTDLSTVVH